MIKIGILDRFKNKEDPQEKTFHSILEKKEKQVGRQAYAEGHLKGVRAREMQRGKSEAMNPQSGGFFGGAGKALDSLMGGPVDEKRMKRIIHGPD